MKKDTHGKVIKWTKILNTMMVQDIQNAKLNLQMCQFWTFLGLHWAIHKIVIVYLKHVNSSATVLLFLPLFTMCDIHTIIHLLAFYISFVLPEWIGS